MTLPFGTSSHPDVDHRRIAFAALGLISLIGFALALYAGVLQGFTLFGINENSHAFWEHHTSNLIALTILSATSFLSLVSSVRLRRQFRQHSMPVPYWAYLLLFLNLLIFTWAARSAVSLYLMLLLFGNPAI